MDTDRQEGRWKATFAGVTMLFLLAAVLVTWQAGWRPLVATAWAVQLLALALVYHALSTSGKRAALARTEAGAAVAALQPAEDVQTARRNDLASLGRLGNRLLDCVDLAEVLQTSEQMLSLMLPESAGTIFPLIDGEGLAEATHLWGEHAAETRLQASPEDCLCMSNRRVQINRSDEPATLCAHIIPPVHDVAITACIPLLAQGQSLGWIYLSSRPADQFPKLQLAVAAADQLALALANLKLRQNLRDLSVRDPLTGLFNRRYLSESLGRELARARRRKLPLAVIAFDLDHFKNFNDRFGHAAGDAVLVAFARVLRNMSRGEDIACRQGGEEFVLIMPEMEEQIALRRSTELMAAMATMEVLHEGHRLPQLTTSIGIAVAPEHGDSPDELLARADQALYEAKARGRNRAVVATPR